MALGKAAKRARNLQKIIQPKLDDKMLSDEFYDELKDRETIDKDEKFRLYVYSHEILGGAKRNKKDWLEWLDVLRYNKVESEIIK